MKKYTFGIDIGGTAIKIGLFDAPGSLFLCEEYPSDTSRGGENIIPDLLGRIDGILAQKHISRDAVAGIGLGVPGPVLSDGTVNKCVNLGWGRFNLEEYVQSLSGFRVKAANDANAAALGEARFGAGRGSSHIIMLTLGTGIGSGIILNGEIYPGAFGSAGEIGHLCAVPDEKKQCSCGKYGCLEQYASAPGIVRLAKEFLASSDMPSRLRNIPDFGAPEIFIASGDCDACAAEICDRFGKILGTALANTANILNPELIIIGGGMAQAGESLLSPIKKYFEKSIFHGCRDASIVPAALGNTAGIFGASELISR